MASDSAEYSLSEKIATPFSTCVYSGSVISPVSLYSERKCLAITFVDSTFGWSKGFTPSTAQAIAVIISHL